MRSWIHIRIFNIIIVVICVTIADAAFPVLLAGETEFFVSWRLSAVVLEINFNRVPELFFIFSRLFLSQEMLLPSHRLLNESMQVVHHIPLFHRFRCSTTDEEVATVWISGETRTREEDVRLPPTQLLFTKHLE